MKKNFAGLLLAFAVPVILYSCKKAAIEPTPLQSPPSVTESLQSWAKAQDAALAFQKVTVDGKTVRVPQFLVVESTQYFPAERMNITPIQVGNTQSSSPTYKYLVTELGEGGTIIKGDYYVILNDKKNAIPVAITAALLNLSKIPSGFNGTIMKYDLDNNIIFTKHYENGALTGKSGSLVTKKGQPDNNAEKGGPVGNYAPLNQGCEYVYIEWYYQVYENGVLIYEEYLETTAVVYCEAGGSGGSGNPTCQEQLQNFANQGSATSGTTFSQDISNDGTIWKKTYNWAIFTAGTWGLLSYDKATFEKIYYASNNTERWEFQSFDHIKIAEVGTNVGGTRTFQDLGATINFTPTKTSAWERIDFSVTSSVLCWPLPPLTNVYNSNKTFYAPNTITVQ